MAVGTMAELEAEVAALRRFKAYVHQRLDEAGIPTHPDGPHSKEGCRIGDRLDIALRGRVKALAAFKEWYQREYPHGCGNAAVEKAFLAGRGQ